MSDKKFVEEVHPAHFTVRYDTSKTLFTGKSDFQKVEVVETLGHGKMLLNDDLVMITDRDEFVYHDMIAHVAMFTHPNPKKVLVVGGGDGGTAREVLRHKSVEYCRMVEIDKMVVDACLEHFPNTSSELKDNPRLKLDIADGVKFMAESDETFDVILIDSTDPIGPATPLFGEEFYSNVSRCLSEDGIVVSQGESPFYNEDMQKKMLTLVKGFPIRTFLNFSNLTYPGGLWSFLFASKKHHPVNDFDANRVSASGLIFNYYNADLHRACFALPQFQLNNLEGLRQF